MSSRHPQSRRSVFIIAAAAVLVAAVATVFLLRRDDSTPAPGSDRYEQVTRTFYRGLSALEVGLLDDARREFAAATDLVPVEPASWANLGLTHLRLGELDAAVEPIERALSLAPDHADLVLMAGRAEIARGRLDEGVAHLRRAVDLDPDAVRARFALADEIERAGGPDADAEALAALDELAQRVPENAAVQVERARVAGKAGDLPRFRDAVARLEPMSATWPAQAVEQYRALQDAAASGDLSRAALTTTFLRNVLASAPAFIEDLTVVRTPTELIAEPLMRFVALPSPVATPSPPELSLSFDAEPLEGPAGATPGVLLAVPSADRTVPLVFAADTVLVRLAGVPGSWPVPVDGGVPSGSTLLALDWNNDFRTDILMAGRSGVSLLLQGDDEAFTDGTPPLDEPFACGCFGAWAADVEMDGDLDVVAARTDGDPFVLRNDGTGTWTPVSMFTGVAGARAFAWGDLDGDADPDAVFIDQTFRLHAFTNRQAGDFIRTAGFPEITDAVAVTVADMDADGRFDVVVLHEGGAITATSQSGGLWETREIAAWEGFSAPLPGIPRLLVADLDNNGALDLIAAGDTESRIWLSDEGHALQALQTAPEAAIFAVADLDDDGRLDLIGRATAPPPSSPDPALSFRPVSRAVRLINRGTSDYHWKVVRPRAQANAGDQRINSFGVGGDIQVRSGLLVQKHLLTGGPVHIGLGEHTDIDVARIVWPNGVAQAEFGLEVDDAFVAEQRLKGSCPWVFAWDGTQMAFVTDFLWRSPLGLRINAQDTAGVSQTEDWVRISADQLAPRNGVYDLRITAELWETHFFDQVALMVVDHPPGTEVYVDERFSPAAPPALKVHAVEGKRPVARARDHRGTDVTDTVALRDGRYLATFAKGVYQGIAEDHFVEFELDPGDLPDDGQLVLLASGWIYPTDSSINVAIGQGGHVAPKGLSLESQRADGQWEVVNADLGFPAGKNKTILVDLEGVRDARRLRLRTNLEIYWDSLEIAKATDAPLRTTKLNAESAELRYRGFSETRSPRGDAPETPQYDRLATTSQRWRDLTGYHTRFGDVLELLESIDDRYVIMNAGDELHMRFAEQPAPADGWRRDFVLIGDGWEKDGDYNTGFSQTVLPLPAHDTPAYGQGVTSLELEDDPVYQRHREDWQRYHTRYVTPRMFVSGLRSTKNTKTD